MMLLSCKRTRFLRNALVKAPTTTTALRVMVVNAKNETTKAFMNALVLAHLLQILITYL